MRQKTFVKYFEVTQSKQNTLLKPREKKFCIDSIYPYLVYINMLWQIQVSTSTLPKPLEPSRDLSMPSGLSADWNLAGLEQGHLV